MEWLPLNCRSDYSLLRSQNKPEALVAAGYPAVGLTDYGTCVGVPDLFTAAKKSKTPVKAIAGEIFSLRGTNDEITILVKNLKGWRSLVRATSNANRPETWSGKPQLSLQELAELGEANFIAIAAPSIEKIPYYIDLFGKNLFLGVEVIDAVNQPELTVRANALREAGKRLCVPCVAMASPHYLSPEDSEDHRILLCTEMKTTLAGAAKKLALPENASLRRFFGSRRYHLPTAEEMAGLHPVEELKATLDIAEMCEAYAVGGKPLLPTFPCPDGLTPDQFFRKLCEEGFHKKVPAGKEKVYRDRFEYEIDILIGAGLSSYFLIVWDMIRHAKEDLKSKVAPGRGSAAGCLVSYLIGITSIDPIRFKLIFERFWSKGRSESGSLPDIDSDFTTKTRDKVIDYLREKYGANRVRLMATFGRMQGCGAIKDVLRVRGTCGFEEMNRITATIPEESKIADDLQEMLEAYQRGEEDHEPSIIRWALQERSKELSEWVHLNEDGVLEGPLAFEFNQAMRLEGTKRSQGRHPSGVIVSSVDLDDVAPLVYDKRLKTQIVGFEMRAAEAAGLIKLDALSTAVLDSLEISEKIIRTGDCE